MIKKDWLTGLVVLHLLTHVAAIYVYSIYGVYVFMCGSLMYYPLLSIEYCACVIVCLLCLYMCYRCVLFVIIVMVVVVMVVVVVVVVVVAVVVVSDGILLRLS